jgi:hypothetical protein
MSEHEYDYMPPVRGVGAPVGHLSMTGAEQRNELLRNAIRDARGQLIGERGRARIWAGWNVEGAPQRAADEAEKRWRANNPGLAALIDHADGCLMGLFSALTIEQRQRLDALREAKRLLAANGYDSKDGDSIVLLARFILTGSKQPPETPP